MAEKTPLQVRNPLINLYTRDVPRLAGFYERLGFRETFRTPEHGTAAHIELSLDNFTLGVASVAAATDHGLKPDLGGRPVEIVLWTDDVDRDYARLVDDGAAPLSPPHDFLAGRLHAGWIADPDGNPVQLVERR